MITLNEYRWLAHGFSFYDSLIVSATLESGFKLSYSEDMYHGQIIEKKLAAYPPRINPTNYSFSTRLKHDLRHALLVPYT